MPHKAALGTLKFVPINTSEHIVAFGAAGWVDYDWSGVLAGTYPVLIACAAGAQTSGARGPGEITAPLIPGNWLATIVANMVNGHVELYRNAAVDAYYELLGYFSHG